MPAADPVPRLKRLVVAAQRVVSKALATVIGLYSLSGLGAWELTRDMDQNWHGFAMGLVLIGLFHGTISVFTLWMAIIDLGKCQELLATAQARRRTGEPN